MSTLSSKSVNMDEDDASNLSGQDRSEELHVAIQVNQSQVINENLDKMTHVKNEVTDISNGTSSNVNGQTESQHISTEVHTMNSITKKTNTSLIQNENDRSIEDGLSEFEDKHVNMEEVEEEVSTIFPEDDDINHVLASDLFSSTQTTTKLMSKNTCLKMTSMSFISRRIKVDRIKDGSDEIKSRRRAPNTIQTLPVPIILQAPSLPDKIERDRRVPSYVHHFEKIKQTKLNEHSSLWIRPSTEQGLIPNINLRQLCQSLTDDDLKDDLIRKKIYELKVMIDRRHRKQKYQSSFSPTLHLNERQSCRKVEHQSSDSFETNKVDRYVPYTCRYPDAMLNYNKNYA